MFYILVSNDKSVNNLFLLPVLNEIFTNFFLSTYEIIFGKV